MTGGCLLPWSGAIVIKTKPTSATTWPTGKPVRNSSGLKMTHELGAVAHESWLLKDRPFFNYAAAAVPSETEQSRRRINFLCALTSSLTCDPQAIMARVEWLPKTLVLLRAELKYFHMHNNDSSARMAGFTFGSTKPSHAKWSWDEVGKNKTISTRVFKLAPLLKDVEISTSETRVIFGLIEFW